MEETISSEEPARSVSGAEALISKHNEQKAEIDAREDSVTQVAKAGRKLIQQSHYASSEVRREGRREGGEGRGRREGGGREGKGVRGECREGEGDGGREGREEGREEGKKGGMEGEKKGGRERGREGWKGGRKGRKREGE